MRTAPKNRIAAPSVDRAVADDLPSGAESVAAKLLRARQLWPPLEAECKACWLRGAQDQLTAAERGAFDPVEPTGAREAHRRGYDAGAAAVRAIFSA